MRKINVGLMGAIMSGSMDSLMKDSNSSSMVIHPSFDYAEEMLKQSELSWGNDYGVQNGFRRIGRRFTQPCYRTQQCTRKKRKAHRAAVKLQRRLKKIRNR